jgi:hypothetical protein
MFPMMSDSSKNKGEVSQKIPRINKKENAICENIWDKAKTVLRGKFIAMNAYIKNQNDIK